jgi:hypothetical protein
MQQTLFIVILTVVIIIMRLAKMIWWWINKEDYHMGDTVTFTYQQGCLGMEVVRNILPCNAH